MKDISITFEVLKILKSIEDKLVLLNNLLIDLTLYVLKPEIDIEVKDTQFSKVLSIDSIYIISPFQIICIFVKVEISLNI
jgi:hypothetical protein